MITGSDDLLSWVEILSVKGISSLKWSRLNRSLPARRIVSMLRSTPGRKELSRLLGRKVTPPDRSLAERQLRFARKDNCGIITVSDRRYPSLLREIADPPPVLFYAGDPGSLDIPAFCVVGSRNASRRGLLFAENIAFELGRRGFTVVSGMARGIDSMVHSGALESGGKTCGVIGCGIDVPYPPENLSLSIEIISNGIIISEFLPGTPPLKFNFPRRNRIMSGISVGILVVEGRIRSGAMNTARWAAGQGREVFAVPGPAGEDGSEGPHRLIRDGACLVESIDDILAAIPRNAILPFDRSVDRSNNTGECLCEVMPSLTGDEKTVLSFIGVDPKHVDELIRICHISANSILPILLNLEMKGLVEACGGGRFAAASKRLSSRAGNEALDPRSPGIDQ
ncbi:MAG: DNA-processing protein DprA [Candidatus Krumholzibacteriota bacterium]|nr:DNA-processing protein DprA [Candidatus Krumholzibacteriota bacterium]